MITCCQTDLSREDIDFIHTSLNDEHITLNTLIRLASQHGILPLVYKTLLALNADTLVVKTKEGCKNLSPYDHDSYLSAEHTTLNTFLSKLKSRYHDIAQRNMLMSAELIRIMRLFKENNIEALAFKGPTLSQMAYGDITLRQYSDLDILIDETQVAFAGEILQKNSYKLLYPQKVLTNKTCLSTLIDVGFLHNNVHIELHWKLLQAKHAGKDALTQAQNFKKDITINAYHISSLANELLLVYLSLHGSKHAWERIEWICDIDRLIRTQEFDWGKSIEIAASSKLKRAYFLGLELAHHFFNTPLPEHILNEIKKANIGTLKQMTITQFNTALETESAFSKNKKIFFYQLKLFESISDKIGFILHTFFKISPADCMTYTLPDGFKFLYIILRPIRLISSYIKRVFIR